jgi:flagellar hook assembly protein FlgD
MHFTLWPNYPNPFRATASNSPTTLRYSLPVRALVTARIHDVLGRRVRQLRQQTEEAGEHTLIWDGKDDRDAALPSGIYFLSVQLVLQNGQRQSAMQKIALVK